jgi:hypothetical protein
MTWPEKLQTFINFNDLGGVWLGTWSPRQVSNFSQDSWGFRGG